MHSFSPASKSLGTKSSIWSLCTQEMVGRARYGWIYLLPRSDLVEAVVQTGKYRSFVTFDDLFCSAARGRAESPRAQRVQLQEERKQGHGLWLKARFRTALLSAPLLSRCSPLGFPTPPWVSQPHEAVGVPAPERGCTDTSLG